MNRCGTSNWVSQALFAGSLLLAGCAGGPQSPAAEDLLRDDLFDRPARAVEASEVLAVSEPMRRYAEATLTGATAPMDRRRALVEALQQRSGLLLDYDTERTRSAAEAYDQRAGNCLSLTLMTAAFAQHLGLPVRFRRVLIDEEFSRSSDLLLAVGHVNIVVGRQGGLPDGREPHWLTIDFLPQADLGRQRAQPIDEATVIAMFMNNRAAEALAGGRPAEAYWWARTALQQDPRYLPGVNTLGVVYSRAGLRREAERAWRYVLARDESNLHALANLSQLLAAEGRDADAAPFAARLAELQPHPPFWYYDRGREALARGDHAAARDLLQRELRLQPHQHEVHFQLALAYHGLGDRARAQRHLALAMDSSPTRGTQALYAGKLERLRALGTH